MYSAVGCWLYANALWASEHKVTPSKVELKFVSSNKLLKNYCKCWTYSRENRDLKSQKWGIYSRSLSNTDSWAKNISKTALLKLCTKISVAQEILKKIVKSALLKVNTELLKNRVVSRTALLQVALLKDLLYYRF